MSLYQILRNFLKKVYVSGYEKIKIADSARIGNYSRLIVTEERGEKKVATKITLHQGVGIGRFSELQVWDGNQIIIKDHTSLNDNCKILGDVLIEKYCTFSANIFASSGNHYATFKPPLLIKEQDKLVLSTAAGRQQHSKRIHIEEDCWIGFGVFIKQGIYIGRGAIIGAYTLVTKEVAPYTVQVGTPNKEIKKRFDFCPPAILDFNNEIHLPYFYRGFCHRADELEEGRKRNVIIAGSETVITLVHVDDPQELEIRAANIMHPAASTLIVSLNGRYQWTIRPSANLADFRLRTIDAQQIENDILYESLGSSVKKHSVICMKVQPELNTSTFSFGINRIKLK